MARHRTRLAIAGATGALALTALGTIAPAIAQDAGEPAPQEERGVRHAEHEQAFAEALAEELGLETAEVQAGLERVREEFAAEAKARRLAALRERLDAAVAEGDLTEEQADAVHAAAESGALPFAGHGPDGRRPGGHRVHRNAPDGDGGAAA